MLVAVLAISAFAFSLNAFAATKFSDIASHKNQTAIEYFEYKKVVNGHPDGTFRPDTTINRAEVLKVLFLAIGEEPAEPTEKCFPDVPLEDWYAKYVCEGKERGYLDGYPDGKFYPAKFINKVEVLKLMGTFMEWDLTEGEGEELFEDTVDGEWYTDYVKYAKAKNYLEYVEDLFYPAEYMIRGEVMEILFRTTLTSSLDTDSYSEADVPTFLEKEELEDVITFEDSDDDVDTSTTTTTTPTVVADASTSDKALNIVIDEVVDGDPDEDWTGVYQKDEPLEDGDYISYIDEKGTGKVIEIDGSDDHWFFWVDRQPYAMFGHEAAVVLVNKTTGVHTEYPTTMWPKVNGTDMYSTASERESSTDLTFIGTELSDYLTFLATDTTVDAPDFGLCKAKPDERRRAIILYVGDDPIIKRNAVNMYNYICGENYVTTVINGSSASQILDDIEDELWDIEADSHIQSYDSILFHVSSDALTNGDLFVDSTTSGSAGARRITIDSVDLDELAAKWGLIGFEIDKTGIWADTFTIMHDTSYSGNALEKYKKEAYIPPTRETAVGWVSAASEDDQPAYATKFAQTGFYYTRAIINCMGDYADYADFGSCVIDKTDDPVGGPVPYISQGPLVEKLTPITDDAVPFMETN
jgi:hypothetical protein